jgi:hypothetical protein
MKTGHVNLLAGALSLLCSLVWVLLTGHAGAALWFVASLAWIAGGFYQIATSDEAETRPVSRIARRFLRIVGDWI